MKKFVEIIDFLNGFFFDEMLEKEILIDNEVNEI